MIFPYIGGEEVNDSPTHAHHRYVINFGERERGGVPRRWPDLMAIVEEKVKPERMAQDNREALREAYWWQFGETRAELCTPRSRAGARAGRSRSVTPALAFAFLPTRSCLRAHAHRLRRSTRYAAFCALQSRAHEIWARFFGRR